MYGNRSPIFINGISRKKIASQCIALKPPKGWVDPVFGHVVMQQARDSCKGASIYDVHKIFGFFDPSPPPVRKFTQPPLLRLLTMSAFEGNPSVRTS